MFYHFILNQASILSYLSAIETAVPAYQYHQNELAAFFQNTAEDVSIKRKMNMVAHKSGIQTRYSVLSDFGKQPIDFTFFEKNWDLSPPVSLTKRMEIYKTNALQLSLSAIRNIANFESIKSSITHIITVTCTGLFAPGLDIELIQALDLSPKTQRNSINFMGCNAAIIALNQANSICNSRVDAKVLVVCTELCTIHIQNSFTDDYLLSNSLFSDGCAAAIVSSKPQNLPEYTDLSITSFDSLIIHEGQNDMAWQLSENGFLMSLSAYISNLINGNISKMLSDLNIQKDKIHFWAIHPGGKKILDDFANVFDLKNNELESAYHVLRNYGNMSSPTILFVLKELIGNDEKKKGGDTIFTAAFGPGLTIETMQLAYV
ncbi:MAG: type III polyketide synthase [Bacteroidota bacterium]